MIKTIAIVHGDNLVARNVDFINPLKDIFVNHQGLLTLTNWDMITISFKDTHYRLVFVRNSNEAIGYIYDSFIQLYDAKQEAINILKSRSKKGEMLLRELFDELEENIKKRTELRYKTFN